MELGSGDRLRGDAHVPRARAYLLDGLVGHAAPSEELVPLLCQLLPAPQPSRQVVSNWIRRGSVRVVGETGEGKSLLAADDLAAMLRRFQPTPQRATRSSGKVA